VSDSFAPAPLCSPGGSLLPSTPGPSSSPAPEARGCPLMGAVARFKWVFCLKCNRWRRGGSCCQAARKRTKRKGVPFGYAPLGLPPSVVPKGRTSDAPLSALINNTVEFRTQDVPLLRSQTLNVYLNFHPKSAYLSHLADCR